MAQSAWEYPSPNYYFTGDASSTGGAIAIPWAHDDDTIKVDKGGLRFT